MSRIEIIEVTYQASLNVPKTEWSIPYAGAFLQVHAMLPAQTRDP
jgi:hypothetical protein